MQNERREHACNKPLSISQMKKNAPSGRSKKFHCDLLTYKAIL